METGTLIETLKQCLDNLPAQQFSIYAAIYSGIKDFQPLIVALIGAAAGFWAFVKYRRDIKIANDADRERKKSLYLLAVSSANYSLALCPGLKEKIDKWLEYNESKDDTERVDPETAKSWQITIGSISNTDYDSLFDKSSLFPMTSIHSLERLSGNIRNLKYFETESYFQKSTVAGISEHILRDIIADAEQLRSSVEPYIRKFIAQELAG
jgi:hypothetical protein